MSILQLVAMAVIGVLGALICKKQNMELGMMISIGICLLLMGFLLQSLQEVITFIEQIAGNLNLTYIGVLFKLIGIAYICEFASGLCKDAGHQAVSGQIEMAGRVAMMVITIPVMSAIIQTIENLLN